MTDAQTAAAWDTVWAANRAAERAWEDYDAALARARLAEDAFHVARRHAEQLEAQRRTA